MGRRALALVVGYLLYVLVPSRRRLTLENLRKAYPALPPKNLRRIARASYKNLVLVFAELLTTEHIPLLEIHSYFRFINPQCVYAALEQGRGVILLSAHLANWEWSAIVAALEFKRPLLVVVKEQRNRVINAWLHYIRTISGNVLVPMQSAARHMLRWLQQGGIVGLLGDQAAEPTSDVFVPLFGHPAVTYTAPVVLARRTGAALVVAYCQRSDTGNYEVYFEELAQANDSAVPIEEVLASYHRCLECAINRTPEQWVWQHNRWKYIPLHWTFHDDYA